MASHSKTDQRYWLGRVYKPQYTSGDKTLTSTGYAVQIQFRKKRYTFSLETTNKTEAARKALNHYLELLAGTHENLKPASPKSRECLPEAELTVGDYLEAVKTVSTVRQRTFQNYVQALRQIIADTQDLADDRRKYDHHSGKHAEWISEINNVPLKRITPELVNQWKLSFLRRAGDDPVKRRTAATSVNSILRNSAALFSTKKQRQLPEQYHYPNPFAEVDLLPRQSHRYHSRVDIQELLRAARSELQVEHPEGVTRVRLSAGGGLRRNEIDKLLWEQVDLTKGLIHIRTTPYFEPKSELSGGEIMLDPEIIKLFEGYRSQSPDQFVITGTGKISGMGGSRHYRCERHFRDLGRWLREKGVTDNKPLHALRKEFGGLICREFGIYAASRALRHANIELTAQHYVDDSQKVRVGLGKILLEPLRVAKPDEDRSPTTLRTAQKVYPVKADLRRHRRTINRRRRVLQMRFRRS